MNIALFVSVFPAVSETFIINQVIALRKKGHLVHVFAQKQSGDKILHSNVLQERLDEITFYLDSLPGGRWGKIWRLLKCVAIHPFNEYTYLLLKTFFSNDRSLSLYTFAHFIGKPHYDVVHAHFGTNGIYLLQLRQSGLFCKAKFVTTFHGFDLEPEYSGQYSTARLFESGQQFITNSAYSRGKLMGLGCPPNKIEVIPMAIDTVLFQRATATTGSPVQLLFVGRFVPFKAPLAVVEIARLLKTKYQAEFSLTMVGDGPMMGEVTEAIMRYQLEDKVFVTGAKSQSDIIRIMNQADIFVYPGITVDGRAENQGVVIQEAQAMELPVLVSDAGGMQEGMKDGVTGYVIREGDIDGFARCVHALMVDGKLRRKIARQAREYAEKHFNIDQNTNQLVAALAP